MNRRWMRGGFHWSPRNLPRGDLDAQVCTEQDAGGGQAPLLRVDQDWPVGGCGGSGSGCVVVLWVAVVHRRWPCGLIETPISRVTCPKMMMIDEAFVTGDPEFRAPSRTCPRALWIDRGGLWQDRPVAEVCATYYEFSQSRRNEWMTSHPVRALAA
jgi:hypothetical protein